MEYVLSMVTTISRHQRIMDARTYLLVLIHRLNLCIHLVSNLLYPKLQWHIPLSPSPSLPLLFSGFATEPDN